MFAEYDREKAQEAVLTMQLRKTEQETVQKHGHVADKDNRRKRLKASEGKS